MIVLIHFPTIFWSAFSLCECILGGLLHLTRPIKANSLDVGIGTAIGGRAVLPANLTRI
jgi:hypothetical protein